MSDSYSKCTMCGKIIKIKTKYVSEKIDDSYYIFDSEYCAMIFKRFRSVYGKDFCWLYESPKL